MNRLLKGLLVAALAMTVTAWAGDEKDLKKIIEDQGIYVETAQKGVVLSGYVDTSYTYQFAGRGEPSNTSSEDEFRAFDTDNNDFNLNAIKLALEKGLGDRNDYAAGFRVDLMFGEDAQAGFLPGGDPDTSTDDLFIEQGYVQARVPWGNGLDLKMGKFVSLMGYEVIESPANLNFSRGLLFANTMPITHTGVMASYRFNDTVDAQFGIVNGWNRSDSGLGVLDGGDFAKALTGRVNVTAPGKNANLAAAFIYSPDGDAGVLASPTGAQENESILVLNLNGNWAPKFANDKLLFGFDSVLGTADRGSNTGGAHDGSTWAGLGLYAKYQFTKLFSLAGRGEYLHTDDGQKFGPTPTGTSSDIYSWTLTAGFDIWENLLTRVEYRYDWAEFDTINGHDQHQLALNVVYSF